MYPASQNMARFSDVVGASHENGFVVWKFNGDASKGLKMLAEQGNTTELELEIQQGVSRNSKRYKILLNVCPHCALSSIRRKKL